MRAKIARWKPVRVLASLELTVVGLLLMALLVIGGTVIQAEKGIYAAQQQVFQSWLFWLFNVLPLPGMLLVGAVLFVNLLAAVAFRLKYRWSGLGLILIHVGLLVLLGGGFISFRYGREYFMTLSEGESSQVATAAHEWELAAWTETGGRRRVQAVDIAALRPGQPWAVSGLDAELTVERFFPNCLPATGAPGEPAVQETAPAADPAENMPGAILEMRGLSGERRRFSLFSGNETPFGLRLADRDCYFLLRLKRTILPVRLTLLDFKKTVYSGSEIPKSFTSRVQVEGGGMRREALVAMNRPLRIAGYTFYQSAYGEDERHGASSTFAVVRNAGRWLPYISSALIFLGLLLHFCGQLAAALTRTRNEVKP